MSNKNNQNETPQGPIDPLAALEPSNPTNFDLVDDMTSLTFEADGYRKYDARRANHEQREAPKDEAEADFRALFADPGGRLEVDHDGYVLETTLTGELSSSALFAGHIATKTGHNVTLKWGHGVDINEAGKPEPFVSSRMPIGSYVEAVRQFPDEMYEPHHADFNMGAQEAYRNQVKVEPGMELSPHDQLVAAHAAKNLVRDFLDDRFEFRIPQDRRLSPDHPNNMPPQES